MSRRKRSAGPPAGAQRAAGREPEPRSRTSGAQAGGRRGSLAADAAIVVAVFALTTAIAELAGAANLGVAIGVGQIAFAIAVVVLMIRG